MKLSYESEMDIFTNANEMYMKESEQRIRNTKLSSSSYQERLQEYYEDLSINPDLYEEELMSAENFLNNLRNQYGSKDA